MRVPQAVAVEVPSPTEIVQNQQATFLNLLTPDARAIYSSVPGDWTTSPASQINYASTYGVGNDNPADPTRLTDQQGQRAVLVMFEQTSVFQVRYAIWQCCTTGRNVSLCSHPPHTHLM